MFRTFEDTSVTGLWLVMAILRVALLGAVYVITITDEDSVSRTHGRCFAHELAARAEAEALAEGRLDWLTSRYGTDEQHTEFEVHRLTMWRPGEVAA